MRALVLALLLGNIVYFVWQLVGYRHQQAVVYHADENQQELLNGERLVLVSERELAAVQPLEPVTMPDAVTEQISVQSEPIPVQAGPEGVSEQADVQAAAAGETVPEVIVDNESEVAAPPAETVSETPVAVEPAQTVATMDNAAPSNHCLYLGVFNPQAQRDQYQQRIKAVGIDAKPLELDVVGAVDYWVHIKPFANRQQALTKLRELQAKQIDSFIIPQGAFQNGISLGVFDKRENAEKRRKEIADKGYQTEIGKNQKMLKEHWLMLDQQNSAKFSHSLFGALKKDFSAVEIKKDQCKSLAQ